MEIVDDRFELGARVAAGGMGVVYQALDRATGEIVALKLLHAEGEEAARRFWRETKILADLAHPGIVRHVAHGTTTKGAPYLVMEWLEGEDLGERLRRGPLSPEEAVRLAARVADALAAAHRRGIVHRDVKPNNIFLQGDKPDRARLVDFGVAHVTSDATHLTQAGVVIGTPAYMAPEQIRAAPVDHRLDVFALGCVLFECLVGHPPWTGASAVAIMAKILFEEPPSLVDLLPELPDALSALLGRMLEKDRMRRPADAAQLAAELRGLSLGTGPGSRAVVRRAPKSLTTAEKRLVCVILADGHRPFDAEQPTMAAPSEGGLLGIAEAYAARLEVLIDGTIAAVITGAGEATDLAMRAARCALSIRRELGPGRIALATGRAIVTDALPTGEAIESAAVLLAGEADPRGAVRIDEATQGLLEMRFEVTRDESSALLVRERPVMDEARRLLGKPTPCVGREAELAAIEADLSRTIDGSEARAFVLLGTAGTGKSRVWHELSQRLARTRAEVWIARGDPMRQGSPLAMLGQAIRQAAGVRDGDGPDEARAKIAACAELAQPGPEGTRIAVFLGEICGVHFPDERSLQLKAARQNAMLMADQMRRAFEDLLLSVTLERPVVLVFEDLQWGDMPTVQFVDAALRNADDRRFFVFAMARPDVDRAFPELWAERRTRRLALSELSKEASASLVRAVLGADTPEEKVARIVELSAGNPFSLEELIRAVAEGRADELPRSVLAVAQARLEAQPEESRLLVRAASIFGDTFWASGIRALLGGKGERTDVTLATLIEREMIVRHADSRFSRRGEEEYAFRHSLLREAAYTMLTDEDRALGHRLAAEWLSAAGEQDAVVLAQHYDRGGDAARAASAYARAAEQALEANDLEAVLSRAARAAQCGARGESLAFLRLLQATAYHWRAEYAKGERAALDALQGLRPVTAAWYRAAEEVAETVMPLGKIAPLVALGKSLRVPPGKGPAAAAFVMAAATVSMQLFLAGKHDDAQAVISRMEQAEARFGDPGPLVRARAHFARATRAVMGGDLGQALDEARITAESYDEAGDRRNAVLMRSNLGYLHIQLGDYDGAERILRDACGAAERIRLPAIVLATRQNLGVALAYKGSLEEAQKLEFECIASCNDQSNTRLGGLSRVYLSMFLVFSGDIDGAIEHANLAVAALQKVPTVCAYALAVLASALLRSGRVEQAVAPAREAMATLEELSALEEGEAFVRLTFARVMRAVGDIVAAEKAVTTARRLLLSRASRIADPRWASSFLERVPENADTLSLAMELTAREDAGDFPSIGETAS